MEMPIDVLKHELAMLRHRLVIGRGMSQKKREAKRLIPEYEAAIELLKRAEAERQNDDSGLNIPVVTKRCCEDCKHFKQINNNSFDSNDIGYRCNKGKFAEWDGDGSDIENYCQMFNAL